MPSPDRVVRAARMLTALASTPDDGLPVAEAGIFTGMTGALLCLRMGKSSYIGVDSFEGLELGLEDAWDNPACKPGRFAKDPSYARMILARFPAEIIVGHIPEALVYFDAPQYRFVHVDVDCYAPTLACLRHFLPRLAPGGGLLCDDFSWPGARLACEQVGGFEVIGAGGDAQAIWRKS